MARRTHPGFTLIQVALALVIAGLLLGISLPRAAAFVDSATVSAAAQEIAGAHRRARMTALVHGRAVVLTLGPDSLAVRLVAEATPLWQSRGPSASGVTMPGPVREIIFSPIGLSVGLANASFPLSRGSATRTVILSRLGRLRITK